MSEEQEMVKAYHEAQQAAVILQEAKLKALQDTIGNYGDFRYVDLEDFIDPDNQNWNDYSYRVFSPLVGIKGRVGAASPVGMLIEHIRNAKNTDDIKKQLEIWNSYKPLDLPHNGESYVNYLIYGLSNAPYGGSRPVFPTTDGSNPVQTTAGGTQGVQAGSTSGSTASTQGAKTGGTGGGTQGAKTGGTSTGGTYASAGVPRGGTKTIGYDPNPGNVSLAYTLRNEPEQVQRAALIAKWNQENGRSGSTYASPSISTGGTYSTGGGIKDANGNVLTNPGGDWEYQYALKNPQYGLGMMSKMSDAQKNYLQAVSDNMGFNYNFTGATRYV